MLICFCQVCAIILMIEEGDILCELQYLVSDITSYCVDQMATS